MELTPKQKEIKKQEEYIAKYYLDETEDLARALNISAAVVRYRINQLGLSAKRQIGRKKIKAEREKAYLEDNIATPTREIAAKTGWAISTISDKFNKYGLRAERRQACKGQKRQWVKAKELLDPLDPRRHNRYELQYVAAYWGLSNTVLSEDLETYMDKIKNLRKCIKHNGIRRELEEEFFREAA